ncbi:unnamed protein product, partial [Effrenium voratum]
MAPKRKPKPPQTFHPHALVAEAHAKSIGLDAAADPAAFQFLCKVLERPLPEPWTEHADQKGRIFYWNKASRSSVWQHPMAPSHKALLRSFQRLSQAKPAEKQAIIEEELEAFRAQGEEELSQWRKNAAADGTPYFYKVGTQLTRWDDPRDELMGHMELRVDALQALIDEERLPELDFAVGSPMDSLDDLGEPKALPELEAELSLPPTGTVAVESEGEARRKKKETQWEGQAEEDTPTSKKKKKNRREEDKGSRSSTPAGLEAPSRPRSRSAERPGRSASKSQYPEAQEQLRQMGFAKRAAREALAASRGDLDKALRLLLEAAENSEEKPSAEVLERIHSRGASPAGSDQRSRRGSRGASPVSGRGRGNLQPPSSPSLARDLAMGGAEEEDVRKAVIPDAMAVTLGMCLQDGSDMALYQMLKPLFLTDLPLPWEVHRQDHGRHDFYHAGIREYRREHPMTSFFQELLSFLRSNTATCEPITELLEVQIFRDASPEVVRYRLGIWEGPMVDEAGGLRFVRQWPGRDAASAQRNERYDDPRLEAAANISFRLGGWLHLWRGFSHEPFPLLPGRLKALCQQLGEAVVTAPGMATTQMIAHMEELLPRLEPPTPPARPVVPELSPEEEALQPMVAALLAKAYSEAIGEASRREMEMMLQDGRLPGDSDDFAARITCNVAYFAAQAIVANLEHEEWAARQFPPEEDLEEFPEDFDDDPFEEEDEEEEEAETSEEEIEEIGERKIESEEELEEEEEDPEDVVALQEDEDQEVEETDDVKPTIPKCKGFLACLETDHTAWARENMRPWTPPSRRPTVSSPKAMWPESPKVSALHRPRLGRQATLWARTNFGDEAEAEVPVMEVAEALLAHAMACPAVDEQEQVAQALLGHVRGDLEVSAESGSKEEKDEEKEQEPASLEQDPAEETREEPREEPHEEPHEQPHEQPHEEEERPQELEESTVAPQSQAQDLESPHWLEVELSPDLQGQVDAFTERLREATTTFNHSTGDDGSYDVDEFLFSAGWNWSTSQPESSEAFRSGRADLARASILDPLTLLESSPQDYESVSRGCAARPPSPNRGKMRLAWYLEDAKEPGSAGFVPRSARPRSSSPRMVRQAPKNAKAQAANARVSRRGVGKPPPKAKLEQRPPSADCYTRPRSEGLLPNRPAPAAVEAAKSTKRFLSRTCGTMQAALATFDPNGDGRFSREEWALGLQKLDFTVSYDAQEIFTVLDKRQHHMLTLSDLLDYCSGVPVDTGMPGPGLRGTISELFQEVMQEELGKIVQEALGEVAMASLQHPSGPAQALPDVLGFVRYLQEKRKQQALEEASSPKYADRFEDESESESTDSEDDTDSEGGEVSEGEEETVQKLKEQLGRAPTPEETRREATAKSTMDKHLVRAALFQLGEELGRAPTREEVAQKKLQDQLGREPTAKETQKEVKKISKVEKRLANQAEAKLSEELGRVPTREEVANRKLQEELGREPTTSELHEETARTKGRTKEERAAVRKDIAHTMTVADQLRQLLGREATVEEVAEKKLEEKLQRPPLEHERAEAMVHVAVHQEQVQEKVQEKLKNQLGRQPTPEETRREAAVTAATDKRLVSQALAQLGVELGRVPTREEVAQKKLQDQLGREPTAKETQKEVKKIAKVEKRLANQAEAKLSEELGRVPTREEVANQKLKEELGREPTTSELHEETARTKGRTKEERAAVRKDVAHTMMVADQLRQLLGREATVEEVAEKKLEEKLQRPPLEHERAEAMVHIAVHQEWHQEKMQLQLRKPDSSSSQRTTQSEARASKGGSSPSRGSSPTSRGNSSPNSRSTSRQDKRGGKKKGRSLMELLTHSFKEDSDGPLDLNWAEAALEGPSTTKGSVDPKEEIAKAKKKLKKKDDRKK